MLRLINITKSFHGKKILNSLYCTINSGDFIVVVGTNGSGKTTLFDIMSGAIFPDAGTIEHQETNITAIPENFRASWISRLYQNPTSNCIASMTVAENCALAFLKSKSASLATALSSSTKSRITELLDYYKLAHLIDIPMSKLSGGQRQLVAFAMATFTRPELLLLDEPTAALDPIAATSLLKTASAYNKTHGLTTLLITHDPEIALALGTKIWVLDKGKIIKIVNQQEKLQISPNDLIGSIDYKALDNKL